MKNNIKEKKLTVKEKMQLSFDEEENRRLRTKARGVDAKLVNPLYRMGDE
tara:strand:- start:2168 stop:2317 length:150 start_codon:yes stop_codon:yes gene_type:complete